MTPSPLAAALEDPPAPARLALEGAFGALAAGELAERVRRSAAALVAAGVRPGDRVVVRARPDVAALEPLLAALRLGAIVVPVAEAATEADVAHAVAVTRPRLALLDGRPLPDASSRLGAGVPLPGTDAPALVVFTSGTTGKPKGAVLSHGAIAACDDALAEAWGWSAADVLLLCLPLFHVHGLCLGLLGSLLRGNRIVLEPRFTPEAALRAFARDGHRDAAPGLARATMLFGVPTMYHRLVERAEQDPAAAATLARARLFVSGSAPLPLRDLERFRAATGHRVVERYGLTETLMNTANRAAGPAEEPSGWRAGSVGRPLPGVSLRIEDDAGVALPPGELGEVTVGGPSLFLGYVVPGAEGPGGALVLERGEAWRAGGEGGGRFATGDVGRLDADGFLWLLGRKSTDILKSAGFKVGAGEVEAALLEHPGVGECAVVGVPDDDLGERIVAVVVARAGADGEPPDPRALLAFAAERLAPYKRPRAVLLRAALPRNAMGKVQKRLLVEELEGSGVISGSSVST